MLGQQYRCGSDSSSSSIGDASSDSDSRRKQQMHTSRAGEQNLASEPNGTEPSRAERSAGDERRATSGKQQAAIAAATTLTDGEQ